MTIQAAAIAAQINLPWSVRTSPGRNGTKDHSIVDATNRLITSDESFDAFAPNLDEMHFIVAAVNAVLSNADT